MGMARGAKGAGFPTFPPLFALGLSLCYVWTFVLDNSERAIEVAALVPNVSTTVIRLAVLIVFALLWKRLHPSGQKYAMLWGIALAGAAHVLLVYGSLSWVPAQLVPWVAEVLREIVFVGLFAVWVDLYGSMPLREAVKIIAGSFLAAALIDAVVLRIPSDAYFGMALLLPAGSVLCLMCSYHALRAHLGPGEAASFDSPPAAGAKTLLSVFGRRSASPSLFPWEIVVLVVAFAVVGSMVTYSFPLDISVVSFGLAGAIILLLFAVSSRRFSIYSIMNISLPAMLFGLLAGSLLGWISPEFAQVCMRGSGALRLAFVTIVVCDRAFRFGISAVFFNMMLRALGEVGSLLGMGVRGAVLTLPLDASVQDAALYFVGIVVFVAVIVFWFKSPLSSFNTRAEEAGHEDLDDGGEENPAVTAASLEGAEAGTGSENPDSARMDEGLSRGINSYRSLVMARCAEISEEYCLSSRESQVLACLARGMSIPRIEKELVISTNTVKTHVSHIYRKLGIHSRDELRILLGVE